MVMAVFAKRLPVALIPEKYGISPVRNNVIDNGCRRQPSIRTAFCTERILFKEKRPGRTPLAVVATLGRVSSEPISAEFGMLLAVHTAVAEVGTARMSAGAFRFSGHGITSQNQQSTVVIHRIAGIQILHGSVQRHH